MLFENLLDLVKFNAGESVINNPAIPNDKNDAVCFEITNSLIRQLQLLTAEKGISASADLLYGKLNVLHNPFIDNITKNITADLIRVFGFDKDVAQSVTVRLVPNLISKLSARIQDPHDHHFDIQQISTLLTESIAEYDTETQKTQTGFWNLLKGFLGFKRKDKSE